ncbi:hypothetical protein CCHOA_06825 [Corynebacterium choanae]|uniref:Uncharacterized protein n=1 Tax=Corynebacterium choanae TaxID=1862358 RepID=A0A3G6J6Q9_9CORY|nr:hypothetical protein CCHOA_06825 [Corynebacterium choanae]
MHGADIADPVNLGESLSRESPLLAQDPTLGCCRLGTPEGVFGSGKRGESYVGYSTASAGWGTAQSGRC